MVGRQGLTFHEFKGLRLICLKRNLGDAIQKRTIFHFSQPMPLSAGKAVGGIAGVGLRDINRA